MGVAVLVPGYGGPGRFVEKWRVKTAERTIEAHGGGFIIVSGHNGEAERLYDLASSETSVIVEPTARSTRENIECSLCSLSGSEHVAIATDRIHRHRAENILWETDPTIADCLVSPRYVAVLEGIAMDAAGVIYEVIRRLRWSLLGAR